MKQEMVPAFAPLGEQAVIVTLGDGHDVSLHKCIVQLARHLSHSSFPGYQECVPSYASLCVYYDVMRVMETLSAEHATQQPYHAVCLWLKHIVNRVLPDIVRVDPEAGKLVRIPVCYCGECGPDLKPLAARNGIAVSEAIAIHCSAQYTVSVIGFTPGFPYMSGLPEPLQVPRMETPRIYVPQGSVAVAGNQTGIYPVASPGGWRVIGRTPLPLFRPEQEAPSLLEVGDTVMFTAVGHDVWAEGGTPDGVAR